VPDGIDAEINAEINARQEKRSTSQGWPGGSWLEECHLDESQIEDR